MANWGLMMTSITGTQPNSPSWSDRVPLWILYLIVGLGICVVVYMVLPKFGSGSNSKVTAAHIEMSNFATALDMFQVDNGHYPNTLSELVVQPRDALNWRQYSESIPLDPWQHQYAYVFPGKHKIYDLSSMGPDGKLGTADDINNWQSKNAK
jgi:general secretion pathway protein G